jgi:N-acetylneuraminic acid mutarotase
MSVMPSSTRVWTPANSFSDDMKCRAYCDHENSNCPVGGWFRLIAILALFLFLVQQAVVVQPLRADSFEQTGSLNIGREQHTATRLSNGDVLIAGGADASAVPISSAELYDPASGRWTMTGSMHVARVAATATLLRDGRVLVAGGVDNTENATSSAELYDPTSGQWTTAGSMNTTRSVHTATLLQDGRVLVFGGSDSTYTPLVSAELYDPASGGWTTTGSMHTTRTLGTATLLPDGKVMAIGGSGGDGRNPILSSAELYEPATGGWTVTGSMITARAGHTATLLPSGKILVAGGVELDAASRSHDLSSAELYNPDDGTWIAIASMNVKRSCHSATLLSDGRVLIAGGINDRDVLTNAELYDPSTGQWLQTARLNTARRDHHATSLSNDKVLITGGWNFLGHALASAEVYDFTNPRLTSITGSEPGVAGVRPLLRQNGGEGATTNQADSGQISSPSSASGSQAPFSLAPQLQEIVKLAQAKMSDDVIVNYIKNAATSFDVSAQDILYLNSQGVSQPVIMALLQSKSIPVSIAVTTAPMSQANPTVSSSYPGQTSFVPGSTDALINQGNAFCQTGQYEQALQSFDAVLQIAPNSGHALYGKAVAEDALKHPTRAIQNYRKFIKLAGPEDSGLVAIARERLSKLGWRAGY